MSLDEQMAHFRRQLKDWKVDYTRKPTWRHRAWRSKKRFTGTPGTGHVLSGINLECIGESLRVRRHDAYRDYSFNEGDALPGGPWETALAQERAHRIEESAQLVRASRELGMDLADEDEYVSLKGWVRDVLQWTSLTRGFYDRHFMRLLPRIRSSSYINGSEIDEDEEGHSTDSDSSDDDYDSGGSYHPYFDHTGQVMETSDDNYSSSNHNDSLESSADHPYDLPIENGATMAVEINTPVGQNATAVLTDSNSDGYDQDVEEEDIKQAATDLLEGPMEKVDDPGTREFVEKENDKDLLADFMGAVHEYTRVDILHVEYGVYATVTNRGWDLVKPVELVSSSLEKLDQWLCK